MTIFQPGMNMLKPAPATIAALRALRIDRQVKLAWPGGRQEGIT